MTDDPQLPARLVNGLPDDEARRLARTAGLREIGSRPPLGQYVRETLDRLRLAWTLARNQSAARFEGNALGSAWSVLNPLLLVASYYLIFGVLLNTRGGIGNYVGYLMSGLLVFAFATTGLGPGAKAVSGNLGLVRSLHFPRALLPLSVVVRELLNNIPTFIVLVLVLPLTKEPPSLKWLLFPVVIGLITVFNVGLSFITARLVNHSPDINNLLGPILRLLRYVSGVFFSIEAVVHKVGAFGPFLEYQPFALALTAVRQTLLQESPINWVQLGILAAWAFGTFAAGFLFFWRGEGGYGRTH